MSSATKQQVLIAKKLGIDVSKDSCIVAAAKIESFVYEAVNPFSKRREATENQLSYLNGFGVNNESKDFLIVSAKIEEELEKRNIAAIKNYNLMPGDTVVTEQYGQEKEDVISSISENLRIWFKGGQGRGCWPSKVIRKIET